MVEMAASMPSLLAPMFRAVQDLLKYKVVSLINTGDRSLDSMINVLAISVIRIVFSTVLWNVIYSKWLLFRAKYGYGSSSMITFDNIEHYIEILKNDKSLMYCIWMRNGNEVFLQNLRTYYAKNFGWEMKKAGAPIIDMTTLKVKELDINDRQQFRLGKVIRPMMPIYVGTGGKIVGLTVTDSGYGVISMVYQSAAILKEFVDMLAEFTRDTKCECKCKCAVECRCKCRQLSCKRLDKCVCVCRCKQMCVCTCVCGSNKKLTNTLCIYEQGRDVDKYIYPDRTFECFVSKHKLFVLNMLDSYLAANNKGKSNFNGMATYNLGFMLSGPPGTGKTLMVKAICNYVHKSADIIDMSTIKTVSKFKSAFHNHYHRVFVMDEFDCVQGIIADRSSTDGIKLETINEKEKLHCRYLNVLKMMSESKGKCEELKEELKKIDQERADLKETLTLSTMLTMFDGMSEVRGRVMVAMTNYPEKIDKALMRSGRFDCVIKLERFDQNETRDMLKMLFKGIASDEHLLLIDDAKFPDGKYTPVDLIQMCTQYQTLVAVLDQIV